MARADRFIEVCELVGNAANVVNPGGGWPGIADIALPSGQTCRVALHVSRVSSHNRAPYEFRFQNPADSTPVASPLGAVPILVGVWEEEYQPTLFIAVDGTSRVGRTSRFSILFDIRVAAQARATGWAVYQSDTGEKIYAFRPTLLPIFVAVLVEGLADELPDSVDDAISNAAIASGLIEDENEDTATRTRRAAAVLVRHSAFSGKVLRAYGRRCAMCGIGTGLVVGAHIHPVAAEGAPDAIWNGLALCHNHHAAFDGHKIWVHPESRAIVIKPSVIAERNESLALSAFLDTTFASLSAPAFPDHLPRRAMFEARYAFFSGRYDWI
ncbi:HNH endonuclease [Paraburkholderia dilworthii]|uniref:HNH endonuclease n=1 Tax=Paraburkholderia dilworthii TaxID=948106 RepID=A0ABW9DG39_9BURK